MPRLLGTLCALLLLTAAPARGWHILLDIDTDGDPATIRTETPDTACLAAVVLVPDYAGEVVTGIAFGLGGSCSECGVVALFGTENKLAPPDLGNWLQDPAYTGWVESLLGVGCPGDPGYLTVFHAVPVDGHVTLAGRVVLARFWVQIAHPVCDEGHFRPPAPDLSVFDTATGGIWNTLQLAVEMTAGRETGWGTLKARYR